MGGLGRWGWRGLGDCTGGRDDALRWTIEEKCGSAEHEDDGGDLGTFEKAAEDCATAQRIAPELGDVDDEACGNQKHSCGVAVLAAARQQKDKARCDGGEADRRVGLNRVNGDAEGRVAPACGEWVSVDDGPGYVRAGSVARSGEERADLFECKAEGKRSGENVGGRAIRHVMNASVDGCDGKGDECCDAGKQRMVYGCDAEDPKRVTVQHIPVGDDEKKTRANESGEEHEDAKIPDAVGIDADSPRDAKGQHQREQKTESGHCSV